MKKSFFILVTLLIFTAANSNLKAQDVSFGYENKSGDTFTAKVTCTQAATVTFELQTSSSLEYKWANYQVWGINSVKVYCTVYTPGRRVDYLTVDLPRGESNVQINGSKTTAIMLVSTINGKPSATRPIVVTFD
ncbi:hypothetical protein [Dysgonomonas sp. ZJ279]|uniref:hypothetical protein n=1 Tax=Dysgonomonas sp. ZJ279 TaxID=2709796 RepID=UPI0013ECEEB9|nr:hypothetical protein [Dysgonomonas sp. ZJ279]